MPSSVTASGDARHHNRFENLAAQMAKAALKNLEKPWREQIGAAIERALKLAGLTQKEGWALLGHNDGAQLNRWIKGTERPQLDTLFAVEMLRQPLAQALAEIAGAEVEVTVRMRRSA